MKKIPLTQGKYALVDDDVFEKISVYKWFYGNRGYAARNKPNVSGGYTVEYMHRIINNTPRGLFTDHINQNKLDNRKANLRSVDRTQNAFNTGKRQFRFKPSSIFKGVTWKEANKKWEVLLRHKGNRYYLGLFTDEQKAGRAYKKKLKELGL